MIGPVGGPGHVLRRFRPTRRQSRRNRRWRLKLYPAPGVYSSHWHSFYIRVTNSAEASLYSIFRAYLIRIGELAYGPGAC